MKVEPIKPLVGAIVRVDKTHLCDQPAVEAALEALEERGVLVAWQRIEIQSDRWRDRVVIARVRGNRSLPLE